jgi:hypothetical protein
MVRRENLGVSQRDAVAALEMQTATLQRRLGCSLQNGFKVFLDAASRGRKMPRFFWGLIFQRDGTLFAGLNRPRAVRRGKNANNMNN